MREGELALDLQVIAILGPDSETAAEMAAAAALQDRLWQFSDLFFLNQGTENSGYVDEDFLAEIAESTPGLDAETALAERDAAPAQSAARRAQRLATRLGVNATPTFIATERGGEPVPLAPSDFSAEAFQRALDQALGR